MAIRNQAWLEKFGVHFREKRIKAGLTQEELSLEANISLSQIARIETGRINPSFCTLYLLASTMKISLSELFEGFENSFTF